MSFGNGIEGVLSLERNPFEVTKAVDFTDIEIDGKWVDWPAPGGFAALMKLDSPMPRIVLGGKGTGRTHVMRHFSAPVQAIRARHDPTEQAISDGVLGIYVRCSGLDSNRFQGRGQTTEAWGSIFAQYADLWLAQAAIQSFLTITEKLPPAPAIQRNITEEIRQLIHDSQFVSGTSLLSLHEDLYRIQRDIDLAVNNAALNPDVPLQLTILTNPGDLVFGVPNALGKHFERLHHITYLYLIDEFENFEIQQQEYVNSLIREKKHGTSFMVGVRTFGLRTLKTLGGGEENKRGSEFDEVIPDWSFRKYTRGEGPNNWFDEFCRRVIARRLSEPRHSGKVLPGDLDRRLDGLFATSEIDHEEALILDRCGSDERPYFVKLRNQLSRARGSGPVPVAPEDIELVVHAARVPSRPLLEKTNVFRIYRAWAAGEGLIDFAQRMLACRPESDAQGEILPNEGHKSVLQYYASDLRAQLCLDARSQPMYAGFNQFIALSDGLPRNLLVILKNIYRWALFYGEEPFRGQPISLEAQRMGILEATEWFISDARPPGGDGEDVLSGISNLGDLFRQSRFSDKPAECSAASFSVDLRRCSVPARALVESAEQRALLVRVDGGQRHKNTGITEDKFHLNRLLSPRWDLPIARRGTFSLKPEEVDAIFDPSQAERFQQVLRDRIRKLTAPFAAGEEEGAYQPSLDLGLYDIGNRRS